MCACIYSGECSYIYEYLRLYCISKKKRTLRMKEPLMVQAESGALEKDRAEILRMLDELREQVKQSCDVTDEPSGSAPITRAADAPSSYGNGDGLSQLRYDALQLHRNGSHHSSSLNVQS
jgi:hypothetical protein